MTGKGLKMGFFNEKENNMNSPVEQFTIKTLYELNFMGIDVSFTNASLFMMLSILGSVCFLYFGSRKQHLYLEDFNP